MGILAPDRSLDFPMQWRLAYPGVPRECYCGGCGALIVDYLPEKFLRKLQDAYKFIAGCCCDSSSSSSGSSGSSSSTSSGECTSFAGLTDATAPSATWNLNWNIGCGVGSGSCTLSYVGSFSISLIPTCSGSLCSSHSSCIGFWSYGGIGTCPGGPDPYLWIGRCCCNAYLLLDVGFIGSGWGAVCDNCSATSVPTTASCGPCTPSGTATKV